MKRGAFLLLAVLSASSAGWAQNLPLTTSDDAAKGTPEERRACAPDVRKFCADLKGDSPSTAYADCLKSHRAQLSKACDGVFKSHGM